MKKTIKSFIVLLIVSSFSIISASAYVPEWIADKGYLYADRFFAGWSEEGVSYALEYNISLEYDELYYHYDKDDTIDWVLVDGMRSSTPPVLSEVCSRFGPYYLVSGEYEYTFLGGVGIYDVKKDQFFDVSDDCYFGWGKGNNYADYREYDGFIEALESVDWHRYGISIYPVGDLDGDDELTIIDATVLQRWIAELEYPMKAKFDRNFMGDYDDDGDVTILDATAIQRNLVGQTTET